MTYYSQMLWKTPKYQVSTQNISNTQKIVAKPSPTPHIVPHIVPNPQQKSRGSLSRPSILLPLIGKRKHKHKGFLRSPNFSGIN